MDKDFLNKLNGATPGVAGILETYLDADDELQMIASYIKKHSQYNDNIDPERIKFLYSPKPKKECYEIIKRSDIEKMVNDQYDFIVTVFYDVWKALDPERKIIVLDKALCGIEIDENLKQKKKPADTKEYFDNIKSYGAQKVFETSEALVLGCLTAVERRKAAKKGELDEEEQTQPAQEE